MQARTHARITARVRAVRARARTHARTPPDKLDTHLSRQLDNPRWWNDDAGVYSQSALLLDLLHHEAADLVVVGDFTP